MWVPYTELYHLETNDMEKGSSYGQGGYSFVFKYFQPAAGSVCWPGGFCTGPHEYVLLSVGLGKNQVSSLTHVQRTKSSLPWRALLANFPAFWLETVRAIRSPGERPITHLNNHKGNMEFPGPLPQQKAAIYFS